MTQLTRIASLACVSLFAMASATGLAGCSVTPKTNDRASFALETQGAQKWFEANVPGFSKRVRSSGGYIIFPAVGQAGVVFFGGKFGRGMVYDSNGSQIGWASVNSGTVGLQIGAQAYKMAMILEDDKVLRRFKDGKWTGDVGATAVAADAGAAGDAQFSDGVLLYIGDQSGLMAGVNLSLANIRYRGVDDID